MVYYTRLGITCIHGLFSFVQPGIFNNNQTTHLCMCSCGYCTKYSFNKVVNLFEAYTKWWDESTYDNSNSPISTKQWNELNSLVDAHLRDSRFFIWIKDYSKNHIYYKNHFILKLDILVINFQTSSPLAWLMFLERESFLSWKFV